GSWRHAAPGAGRAARLADSLPGPVEHRLAQVDQGGVEVRQGPPAAGERRPQLPVAQVRRGGPQGAAHPGPVRGEALEPLDGGHGHPTRSKPARKRLSAGSSPPVVIRCRPSHGHFTDRSLANPPRRAGVLPLTDTALLDTKFARIGARLKVAGVY